MEELKENQKDENDTKKVAEISNAQFFKCLLKKFWSNFSWAFIVVIVMIIVFTCFIFVGAIPSNSMEHTLHSGNFIFGNRLDKTFERGEIVVFESEEYNCYLIKRIIGVAGDTVEIKSDGVYVNDTLVDEPYAVGSTIEPQEGRVFVVPENCLLLFGDNREHSTDSRYFEQPYINTSSVVCSVFGTASFGGDDGVYIKGVK